MLIAITGTPGTGKTELAKRLSKKLGFDLIHLNEYAKKHGYITGRDKERGSDIVNTDALSRLRLEGPIIIEGHLAHYIKSDLIIVLRCSPEELAKRLKRRKWAKAKIKENVEAECLGIIISEALSRNNNVYEIETTKKSISDSLEAAMDVVKGKRNKYKPKVDYLEKISELGDIVK